MTEWQPIETAPRDGKLIVVYTEGIVDIAFYGAREHWVTFAFNRGKSPTHWIPLPEPPEEE